MEEKFLLVVNVVKALNALGCTFEYEFDDDYMYIFGISSHCGILLGLLWCRSSIFAFYPCDKGIKVLYLG